MDGLLILAGSYGAGRAAALYGVHGKTPKLPSNLKTVALHAVGAYGSIIIGARFMPGQSPLLASALVGAASSWVYDCDGNIVLM